MYRRSLLPLVRETLADSPVVLLQGARQTGKTTLVEKLGEETGAAYQSLDVATTLAAVRADPAGFLASYRDRPLILDEVQRFPELLLPMKVEVDRGRRPGRFLLTGSASLLSLPRLSESLAGRMRILTLWPLSQGEIAGVDERFIERVFDRTGDAGFSGQDALMEGGDVLSAALQGGYPERVGKTNATQNRSWYQSYLSTILERDVRDISDIQAPADLLRLLALVATRHGSLVNYSDLSRGLGMVDTTLKRYLALLEKVFLVRRVAAWSANLDKRVIKAPKLYLSDSGLLAHLLGIDRERLRYDPGLAGPLIETMVYTELLKQSGWSAVQPSIHHFRTAGQHEVDFVLERPGGEIVGIEVKAASDVGAQHFKGLKVLQEVAGSRFLRGIVLYRGREVVPFGKHLWAVPIPMLWQ